MKNFIKNIIAALMLMTVLLLSVSCGNNATSDELQATPENSAEHIHIWGEWITIKEPSCVSAGLSERTCACGEKNSILTSSAHKSDDWIVDKPATLREDGKQHQVCSVCNKIFNETVIKKPIGKELPAINDEQQDKLRPSYNLGNCKNLKGTPVVVLLFVDDNTSSWTKAEVENFTSNEVLPGLEFLEQNAKKWNVDLDFVVESYSTATKGYEIKYEGNVQNFTNDLLNKVADDIIGEKSGWRLYSYYKSKYPNDDIIFLNCLNKCERSCAKLIDLPQLTTYTEHCIVFAEYNQQYTSGSRASVVAHEILHLFGAEDYYKPEARTNLAELIYPNDIMLHQYEKITQNTIEDCTAYSVGWTNTVPEICYEEAWW